MRVYPQALVRGRGRHVLCVRRGRHGVRRGRGRGRGREGRSRKVKDVPGGSRQLVLTGGEDGRGRPLVDARPRLAHLLQRPRGREAPRGVAEVRAAEEGRGAHGGGRASLARRGGRLRVVRVVDAGRKTLGLGRRRLRSVHELLQRLGVHDELGGEARVLRGGLVGRRGVLHPLLDHDAVRLRQVGDVGALGERGRGLEGGRVRRLNTSKT